MAGKYAKVVKTLPKFVGRDAQTQRVEALAISISQEPDFVRQASSLAATYTKLRAMRTLLDHVESSLELRTKAIEMLTLDQLENESTLAIKLDEGVVVFEEAVADLIDEILSVKELELKLNLTPTVYYQSEPYGTVEDKDLFREWCVANGLGEKLQLWPTTMQSIVKERLLAGDTLPDGVTATNKPKLTF
jgi:hypothetical protein